MKMNIGLMLGVGLGVGVSIVVLWKLLQSYEVKDDTIGGGGSKPLPLEAWAFYKSLGGINLRVRPKEGAVHISREQIRPDIREVLEKAFARALKSFPLAFSPSSNEGAPKLVFASADTEGGMPHTLGNCVIFPVSYSREYHEDREYETMVHELCHIHQRQFPEMWGELYSRLGFERIPPGSSTLGALQNINGGGGGGGRIVANPDVHGSLQTGWWMYKGQAGALVFEPGASHLRDHSHQVFPVTPDAVVDENYLREGFGSVVSQLDHPNEITACAIGGYQDQCIRGVPFEGNEKEKSFFNTIYKWIRENRTYV